LIPETKKWMNIREIIDKSKEINTNSFTVLFELSNGAESVLVKASDG